MEKSALSLKEDLDTNPKEHQLKQFEMNAINYLSTEETRFLNLKKLEWGFVIIIK